MNYYEKQINGLIAILNDHKDTMIARSYVEEKLNMILNGGINFHSLIRKSINRDYYISDAPTTPEPEDDY